MNNGPISWSSRLQKLCAQSSAESEIYAVTDSAKEAVHIKLLCEDQFIREPGRPLTIYEDNTACIHMGHGLLGSKAAKHVAVRLRFLPGKRASPRRSNRVQQGRHQGPGSRRFHESVARTIILCFPRHCASSFLSDVFLYAGKRILLFSFHFFLFMASKYIFHFQRKGRKCWRCITCRFSQVSLVQASSSSLEYNRFVPCCDGLYVELRFHISAYQRFKS
jgi:hypothetical protein